MNVGACPAAPRSVRLAHRLRDALPPILPTLGGAIGWGAAAGSCALSGLMLDDWQTPAKIRAVFLLFALGGFVAFPFGLYFARLLAGWRQTGETAFAAAFLCLTLATIAATAALYGLQYREYYAQWHEEAFTLIWFLQFIHTLAAAAYQFAVLGLRLYFPLGFVALLAVSLWFARRPR